jgi:hypothetical protein
LPDKLDEFKLVPVTVTEDAFSLFHITRAEVESMASADIVRVGVGRRVVIVLLSVSEPAELLEVIVTLYVVFGVSPDIVSLPELE